MIMQTTTPTNGGGRTGATWVAATGAFLLLAAATMFVATRWDQIPDAAKLAALVGVTGACTLIGDRLRRTLPATGNALFHLGALLVPIDVAALGLRTTMTWQELLFVDGVIATAVLTACAWRARSVVLAATASAGVLAIAGGIAALTGAPGPFVLAAIATAACFVPRLERHAFTWAGATAIAPLAFLVLDRAITGHGVATELGLLRVAWPWSVATTLLVTFVVARAARVREEPPLVLIALVAAGAHGVAVWQGTDVPHIVDVLAAPALFVVAELIVLAVRRDPFWSRPAHVAGQVIEALAAVPTVLAVPGALYLAAISDFEPATDLAIAAALGVLGWILAEGRRTTSSWAPLPAASALAVFAIAEATGSPAAIAATALIIGFAAVISLTGERAFHLAYAAAGFATIVAMLDERVALAASMSAAAVFALAVVRAPDTYRDQRLAGLAFAVWALLIGELTGAGPVGIMAATVLWPVACWVLGLVADTIDEHAGDLLRAVAFGVLPFLLLGTPVEALPAAMVLTVLASVTAMRTRRPILAFAAVVPAVATEVALAGTAGLDLADGGVALCIAASMWLGLAALAREPWRAPLAAAAGASAAVGLFGAATNATSFGPALIITGVLALASGLVLEDGRLSHLGGAVATVGLWVTLGVRHVQVSELYVAPVALQLLLAGVVLRAGAVRRPSSWVAYGPAIALLAGSALAERIAGGSAWHSLVAGAVGVAAVAAGGSKRALAPLLLGTGTLVAVVARETLDSNAGVPTWAWLAAGGSALIGAAVAMERSDVSPIEAGRRVVDVLGSYFD
jgi:hypothetical protein